MSYNDAINLLVCEFFTYFKLDYVESMWTSYFIPVPDFTYFNVY